MVPWRRGSSEVSPHPAAWAEKIRAANGWAAPGPADHLVDSDFRRTTRMPPRRESWLRLQAAWQVVQARAARMTAAGRE